MWWKVLNRVIKRPNMIQKNYLLSSFIWFITDLFENCQGKALSWKLKKSFAFHPHKKDFAWKSSPQFFPDSIPFYFDHWKYVNSKERDSMIFSETSKANDPLRNCRIYLFFIFLTTHHPFFLSTFSPSLKCSFKTFQQLTDQLEQFLGERLTAWLTVSESEVLRVNVEITQEEPSNMQCILFHLVWICANCAYVKMDMLRWVVLMCADNVKYLRLHLFQACRAVLCTPPPDCKSFQMGSSCCEFICLDDTLGASSTSSDIGIWLIATGITATVSLTLLFFVINRFRQRKSQMRHQNQSNQDDQRSNMVTWEHGYMGSIPMEYPYEHQNSHFQLWKPFFPRGEAPPP